MKLSAEIADAAESTAQPLLLGGAGLLLRSRPAVLMRRAVIAQELAEKNWNFTHLSLCHALDAWAVFLFQTHGACRGLGLTPSRTIDPKLRRCSLTTSVN